MYSTFCCLSFGLIVLANIGVDYVLRCAVLLVLGRPCALPASPLTRVTGFVAMFARRDPLRVFERQLRSTRPSRSAALSPFPDACGRQMQELRGLRGI